MARKGTQLGEEQRERKGDRKRQRNERERKARSKEERKVRERATAGKEREIGGTNIMIRGWNRSVVIVVTVGNGVTRRPNALNGRGVVRRNSVQWCHILHRLLFLTRDPLCHNEFKQ